MKSVIEGVHPYLHRHLWMFGCILNYTHRGDYGIRMWHEVYLSDAQMIVLGAGGTIFFPDGTVE